MTSCDYLIIGGGVIGASVACHLSAQGAKNIVVVEQEPVIGMGSTSRSAAGVRQQFSTEVNVRICKRSVELMETFEEEHGQEIEFRQCGYLFLLPNEELEARFRESLILWERLGVPSRWVTPTEIRERCPFLRTDDIVGGTFCPTDGAVDPSALNYGYYRSAVRNGVEFRFRERVQQIKVEGGAVRRVVTEKDTYETPVVINAAGPSLDRVSALAGIEVPAVPVRRHCFTTEIIDDGKHKDIPMCVDMASGLYFRGESGGLLLGLANKDEPAGWNLDVDWGLLETIAEAFEHRAPDLADIEIRKGWAGLYSVTPDHQGIVGDVPDVSGFYLCGGFSGHGIMQSPAVGEGLAHLILQGSYGPLDLSELNLRRFEHAVHAEQNVI